MCRACRIMILLPVVMGWTVLAAEDPPALPPGLGDSISEPGLPAGLDGGKESAPGLPPGLDSGGAEEPGLPAGLAEEKPAPTDQAQSDATSWRDRLPFPLYGFWETRAGIRTQPDAAQPADAVLGEARLQLKTTINVRDVTLDYTGDVYLDGVIENADYDLRRLRLTWSPLSSVDVRAGRQVLTWGTGDMLFINDLFPKDWQSFFTGRDVEYLKAPSDAVRIGWFTDPLNIDLVYTPQFAPDRYITGERISYWNPLLQGHAGKHDDVNANAPSDWFEDDEWAVRLYRNIGATEVAVYGYSGYWKSPGGQDLFANQATFPKLRVYGASARGALAGGVANLEIGYYDSYEDRSGKDPWTNNSELRLLAGYEHELAKEFTGAVQYYVEHMMDYEAYTDTRWRIMPKRDENRHVMTVRLTKLLMNQTLTLSLFGYYSPSDEDAYLRPLATYKATDQWIVEVGGNVFLGARDDSFFGQFEDNTNVYAGLRYAF